MKSAKTKSEVVNARRKRMKQVLINALGGQCCCCGYDKCQHALEFHHIDPTTKCFGIGLMISKSIEDITTEIKKCVVVCSNCHKEVHANITKLPINTPRLSDAFIFKGWNLIIPREFGVCPICKGKKYKNFQHCSNNCKGIAARRVNRPSKEELQLLIYNNTWVSIGRMYNVSDNTIRKWAKYYGITKIN